MGSTVLTSVVVLALAAMAYYFIDLKALLSKSTEEQIIVPAYNWTNPELALKLLTKLDLLEPGYNSCEADLLVPGYKYDLPLYGLKHDDDYCIKHREYIVDYPEAMFEDDNIFTDHPEGSMVREKVMKQIGPDSMPAVGAHMPPEIREARVHILSPIITIMFVNSAVYKYQHLGKTFGCISQIYNQIPGHDNLNRKSEVAKSIVAYGEKFHDRPQCFTFDKFFPKTYILNNQSQCEEFFRIINSSEYQALKAERRIVYIRKIGIGAHRAEGVQPVNEAEEQDIRNQYGNGADCYKGTENKNLIIQHYVYNALLLDGHKFDFRIYMLVASTNPLMLYYHDGFLRLSLHKYDVNSDDKDVLLTNTALSKNIFEEVTRGGGLFNGMNETQLRDFQMWSFEQLQSYLLKKEIIKDENWLDNHLRPQFQKAMVHLIRMVKSTFLSYSPLYELYGADFMLDEEMNLWFLEMNTSPSLIPSSQSKENFYYRMLHDQFNILIGLLKSRMKRVVVLINQITVKIERSKLPWEEYVNQNYDVMRKQWRDALVNRFEPEFQPRANNTFVLITDESKQGVERYSGLLEKECIDY